MTGRFSSAARRASLALSLCVLSACGGGDDEGTPEAVPSTTTTASPEGAAPPATPAPTAPAGEPDLGAVRARLVKVASLNGPTAMAVRPGDDTVYVAEKGGRVRAVAGGQGESPSVSDAAVLDLSGQVSRGSEQGLLGLTFSPDGSRLYVDYTDTAGDSRVVEYPFRDGRADVNGRRELLMVDQPFANHNGGEVAFGPDGKLYIGFGDGGGQGDPANRGQNLDTLLGKILRIDPQPSGSRPYTVPSDNPFVGRDGARPEIWVYGVRNPWRFTWDRQTGDLWVADVGANQWEEVDFLANGREAGVNLGWSQMDSKHPFKGQNPPGAVVPIFEYTHDGGNCSIVGGYVYRGARIPALRGGYVYGDTCSGRIWGLTQEAGRVVDQQELRLAGADDLAISSFGEDAAGELYVLDLQSGLYRFEPS